ncbi:MAG TPA: tetratricopeptide repeat protein [Planctomycetota bacterium]|nr:tetratricopeptide repeat protein [Planctomycetota bacterium]
MKIGKFDISIPTIVLFVGTVVAAFVLHAMWKKSADIRYEAFYRSTILQGMYDDTPEAGAKAIEACKAVIENNPKQFAARMYLGDLQMKQKQYKEALKAYQEAIPVAADGKQKALALVGQGTAAFYSAPKGDLAKGAEAAEPLFVQANEADKLNVDAMVNLALVDYYRNEKDGLQKAEKWCTLALNAVGVPTVKATEQLHLLAGQIALRNDKPNEAALHFERARTMKRNWKVADDSRRLAFLATAVQKGLPPKERREIVTKLEYDITKYGKDQGMAYNAMAMGNFMMKTEPSYNEKELVAALRLFGKAMEVDAKDPRGYINLAALHEDRIADLAMKLNIPVTGINGETIPANRWKDPEKPTKFPAAERLVINQIKAILKEEDEVWKKCIEKSKLTDAQKINAKLRQLSCVRRLIYLLEYDEEPVQRPNLLTRATSIAKDLDALAPNDPVVKYSLGHLLLDKGDYMGAAKLFAQAAEGDWKKPPELQKILDQLNFKPQVVDVRPREGRRYLGPRPLISGTLRAVTAAGPPKKATMKLGAMSVEPVLSPPLGLQVLFYPTDKELADGDQDVAISVVDALDQQIDFPPFKFGLDKQAPSWSVAPAQGAPLTTKPVFTITLQDRGGIDFSSLKLSIKPAGTKSTRNIIMVADGRCKISMLTLEPPRKIGFPIDTDQFIVSPGELTAGDWELSISVADPSGNILTDTKTYSIK